MTLSTGISRSSRTNAALFAKDQRSGRVAVDFTATMGKILPLARQEENCNGCCNAGQFRTGGQVGLTSINY